MNDTKQPQKLRWEEEQPCVRDGETDPWETVLGKAYLRVVGEVENALTLNREGSFMTADLVLQRGLLAAEKMLTEANHPLDPYTKEAGTQETEE